MRLLALYLSLGVFFSLLGCDSGQTQLIASTADEGVTPLRDGPLVLADSAFDALSPEAGMPDASSLDTHVPDANTPMCNTADMVTSRSTIGVQNCLVSRPGVNDAPLVSVVVSGDSLSSALSTPGHTAEEYAQLKAARIDVVQLIIPLKGLMPLEGTLDGAFMERICRHVSLATAAELPVVLTGYGDDPRGGLPSGIPDWLKSRADDALARWESFWLEDGELYVEGWSRMIERCPIDAKVVGVHPMLAPRFAGSEPTRERVSMIFDSVARVLEEKYGRVFRLVEELEGPAGAHPVWRDGYPNVLAPSGWVKIGEEVGLSEGRLADLTERARLAGLPLWISGIVAGSPDTLMAQLDLLAEENHHISLWHDGSTAPYGLREESRTFNSTWDAFQSRPRLLEALGRDFSFNYDSEGVTVSWLPIEAGMPETLRFSAGVLGASPVAMVDAVDLIDFLVSHDPRTDDLTLVILAGGGARSVRLKRGRATGR
ncbi:MAG: hypothetical protein ACON3Z_02505 [Bradymonadia bacterium]